MALQLGALRNAPLEAGATADKADKAAEEVAGRDNRIAGVQTRLAVLTWMAGANLALTLLLQRFRPAGTTARKRCRTAQLAQLARAHGS
jgi:hypothetical protein